MSMTRAKNRRRRKIELTSDSPFSIEKFMVDFVLYFLIAIFVFIIATLGLLGGLR
jgi:hypothetical protein